MKIHHSYYFRAFGWGFGTKIFDGVIRFFTLPILLGYFGVDSFGLIGLVLSVNAIALILNLGLNVGLVKHFTEWIEEKNLALLQRVFETSLSFYLIIALLNSAMLIIVSLNSQFFDLESSQASVFVSCIYLSIFATIPYWIAEPFKQVLIADKKIDFIHQVSFLRAILNLFAILVTINLKLEVVFYVGLVLTAESIGGFFIIYKAYKSSVLNGCRLSLHLNDCSGVIKYSLAIFAMGLFQSLAMQARPLVLGSFSTDGIQDLALFRIIEVFPSFIIALSASVISTLLPKTTIFLKTKNTVALHKLAYHGTRYTTILLSIICFPIILSSKEILSLYVGYNYGYLGPWLSLWILCLLLSLHNIPVASILLATGKTKALVLCSFCSATISILSQIILIKYFGVGSAVLSFLCYNVLQMSFYYLYFNQKILHLDSYKIFTQFFKVVAISSIACIPGMLLQNESFLLLIFLRGLVWFIFFSFLVFGMKFLDLKTIIRSLNK
ncbi:polysaccharide biosynthesis C-terminal domain-containing protein [bacterium]|nr:polysaccharide biosynthesis C-terminal domain-containing protein [bacterium]